MTLIPLAHIGASNLETADALEDCKNHIEQLYDVFGVDSKHEMQKWYIEYFISMTK